MHFGQKVMERMYQIEDGPKSGSKFLLQIENGPLANSAIDPRRPLKPRAQNGALAQKMADFSLRGPFQKWPLVEFSHFGSLAAPTKPVV
jgi:hypothetical protein